MDAKRPGSGLILVGPTARGFGGSHYARLFGIRAEMGDGPQNSHAKDMAWLTAVPRTDLEQGPAVARAVAELIESGMVRSAHDVSDGGLLTAVAEMLIAGSTPGAPIGADLGAFEGDSPLLAELFSETPSRYILEVDESDETLDRLAESLGDIPWMHFGSLTNTGRLVGPGDLDVAVEDLARAWLGTLDW